MLDLSKYEKNDVLSYLTMKMTKGLMPQINWYCNLGYNVRINYLAVARSTTNIGSTSVKIHGANLWNRHIDTCEKYGHRISLKKHLTNSKIDSYEVNGEVG